MKEFCLLPCGMQYEHDVMHKCKGNKHLLGSPTTIGKNKVSAHFSEMSTPSSIILVDSTDTSKCCSTIVVQESNRIIVHDLHSSKILRSLNYNLNDSVGHNDFGDEELNIVDSSCHS